MNITIRAAHYTLTDEIRTRVEAKLKSAEKLLGHSAATALVAVELSQVAGHHSGDIFEVIVNVDTGPHLVRATATGETMEAAIDKVESELMHELRNSKGKRRGIMRRTGAAMKSWMQSWRN